MPRGTGWGGQDSARAGGRGEGGSIGGRGQCGIPGLGGGPWRSGHNDDQGPDNHAADAPP